MRTLEAEFGASIGGFEIEADLVASSGITLALLGPNGSGKTSILRALAGLLPLRWGSVRFDNRIWSDAQAGVVVPIKERGIGFVFQSRALFPSLSVADNVTFGAPRGLPRAEARWRAAELLERLGFEHLADRNVTALSGGEAQGVALARALFAEPRVLLLDEPLTALDVDRRATARRAIAGALGAFDGVRILVTHDPVEAALLADQVAIVEEGRIVQRGTFEKICSRPRSSFAAALAGINLFSGTLERAGHATHLRTEGGVLVVASDLPNGSPVLATVHPHSVLVSLEPAQSSARNVLPCTVASVDTWAGRVRVRLDGELPLTAEITLDAVRELGLVSGSRCFATIKATEIGVHLA